MVVCDHLKSFSICVAGVTLSSGDTVTDFHQSGINTNLMKFMGIVPDITH